MRILGIESSCDETSASIVEAHSESIQVLSNVVASSQELQAKWGGVVPEQAARKQVESIIPVISEALAFSSSSLNAKRYTLTPPIDAIAVTEGPGLIGPLLVGVETAKTLSYLWHKPIIPVNHLLGHIYASWLPSSDQVLSSKFQVPKFPALCLIVSGGHTMLVLMNGHNSLKLIGQTRDDAAGEAFDKTARLLGLPYPGGPSIQKAAEKGTPKAFRLPRPMLDSQDYDFSFSGLKTAVLRIIENSLITQLRIEQDKEKILNLTTRNSQFISDLALEVQEAITDVLVEKTLAAAKEYHVKSIVVGGGVAANARLKEKFQVLSSKFQVHIPPLTLCTDNAAVIATTAYFHNNPQPWKTISAKPNFPLI